MNRFWSKVDVRGPDECWEWLASKQSAGYGVFGRGTRAEGTELAHRMAWELTNGPIPHGLWALHHCDNPPCCNPTHLFLGTHDENMADMVRKGRHPKGEAVFGARLKAQDVSAIRQLLRRGLSGISIAIRFGVSHRVISDIKMGKTWQHIR